MTIPDGLAGFDLADIRRAPRECDAPDAALGDILVCGQRESNLEKLGDPVPTQLLLPRAELRIAGDARLSLDAQQVELMPGIVSQRALVTIRWPF